MPHIYTQLRIGFLLFWLSFSTVLAQTSPPAQPFCGIPGISPAEAQSLVRQANQALQRQRASGAPFDNVRYIPIRPHIVRRSDGSGGLTLAGLNQRLVLTNSNFLFNGFGIQFYFSGSTPDYIDDDQLYSNFSYPEGSTVDGRDAPNAMNQYYVYSFAAFVSGYAQYPYNSLQSTHSFISVGDQSQPNRDGNYVIPHELGHNFNLLHTHGPVNNQPTDELVTRGAGANCPTAGDFICDTPADPFYTPEYGYQLDGNGCAFYSGTARDANGEPYAPMVNNMMSYNTQTCPYLFTVGQQDRLQAGLALRYSHTAYTLDAPPTSVTPPGNLTASFAMGAVVLTWQDNANNEMGYFIERSTSPTSGFSAIGGVAPNVTTFTDTKFTPRTVYYYRIRPSNTTTGSLSSTIDVSTTSPPIGGLATTNITLTSAQLNWNSLGPGVTYTVQWRVLGAPTWNTASNWAENTFVLNNLSAATAYEWQVKESSNDQYSGPVGFATLCPVPQYPGSSPARASATLYWSGSNQQTYNLQWRQQGAPDWVTVSSLTTTAFSLTGLSANTPYEWRVQGICSPTVTSAYTDTQSFTTYACGVPNSLSSTLIRSGGATLVWYTAYQDPARTFDLRYRPVNTATWTTVSSLTANTYAVTGLTNNTTYEWQVRSVCSVSETSDYAPPGTFTTFCLVPGNLSGNATFTSATLYWGVAGQPEPGSTYELQYRPAGNPGWTTVTGSSVSSNNSRTLIGLTPATSYEARVRTICPAAGQYDYSSPFTFSTGCYAPAPNSLYVNSVNTTSALLSWFLPSDPTSAVDLRYRPTGTANWTSVGSLTATGTDSYTLTGLASNTTYEWQLRTVCSTTASTTYTPGPAFTTRCPIPTNLTNNYTNQVTSKTLVWSQTEPGATYELRYRTAGAVNWTTISNLTSLSTVLTNLTSSTTYEWQIRSRCGGDTYSDFSTTFTFQTASCSTPYGLFVTLVNVNSARLNWSLNGADAATRYEARYRVVGNTDWVVLGNLSSDNGSGYYNLTNLITNTIYEWQIRTICSPAEVSAFVAGTTFKTGCPVPASLFTDVQVTSATLYWAQSISGLTYELRYRPTGTANWTTVSNLTTTYAAVTGLTASTTYEWQVSTQCSGGVSSSFSDIGTFTTYSCGPPYFVYVTNLTPSSARLNWSFSYANADTRYEALYRPIGTTTWITLSNLTSTNGTGYFDISGLTNNTSYEWQIRTICSPTESSPFTLTTVFTTLCSIPESLYATARTTSATLYWSASAGSSNYELRYRPTGSVSWTTISNLTGTSTTITGLSGSTTYEWQIRTRCIGGVDSDFSTVRMFTTVACSAPVGLQTTNLTTTSARLNWIFSQATADTRYEARYRQAGTTTWITLSNLTSTDGAGYFDISGLMSNRQYEWQIRTFCSPSEGSAFTNIAIFQTLSPCSIMYSLKDGVWNDVSVWSCNRLPTSSDVIQIKHTVTIPANYAGSVLKVGFDSNRKLTFETGARLKLQF